MATEYKKISSLKKALENCPAEKLVHVKSSEYEVISTEDYKFLQYFNIKLAAVHPDFTGQYGGYKHFKITGYRVSHKVFEIISANQKMINDIVKYI